MNPQPDLSVVTITYNERENIGKLIDSIEGACSASKITCEIIVVDDSSPDGTADIVSEKKRKYSNITLISRKGKLGIASAYGTGGEAAKGEVVVFMDADFSHPPNVIPEMYRSAKSGNVTIGSRYVVEGSFVSHFFRMTGTGLLNRAIWYFLNTSVCDNTNGYLAIRREYLRKIVDYGRTRRVDPFNRILYQLPIIYMARMFGIGIREISAPYKFRVHGETKIRALDGLMIVLDNFMYIPYLILKIGLPKPLTPRKGG